MTDQDAEPAEEFHRDRREHGGAPAHPDDDRLPRLTQGERGRGGRGAHPPRGAPPAHPDEDRLARVTEEERVEAGLAAYDPDEVPDAEDGEPVTDITQTD